jgi:hypothetical protein
MASDRDRFGVRCGYRREGAVLLADSHRFSHGFRTAKDFSLVGKYGSN